MKAIHLLRHAKSDWSNTSLDDIDRPLNARGIRTANQMATELVKAGCTFKHIFCSPAVRAQSTITLISEQLAELKVAWQTDARLYTFEYADLYRWFQSLDDTIDSLLLVGHNPALTHFCNTLSHGNIHNISTCGYVQLTATESCSWQQLAQTRFAVKTFLKPKTLGIY